MVDIRPEEYDEMTFPGQYRKRQTNPLFIPYFQNAMCPLTSCIAIHVPGRPSPATIMATGYEQGIQPYTFFHGIVEASM